MFEISLSFWIFFYILLIVFIVEFFTYVRRNEMFKNKKEFEKRSNYDFNSNESKKVLLDDYCTLKDVQIELLPGKFLISNNEGVFIKIKDRVIIPDVNLLYNISENFTLEIINVNGQRINYSYKKNIL